MFFIKQIQNITFLACIITIYGISAMDYILLHWIRSMWKGKGIARANLANNRPAQAQTRSSSSKTELEPGLGLELELELEAESEPES